MTLRSIFLTLFCLVAAAAYAQPGLKIKGNRFIEILSSEGKDLRGILSRPSFAPGSFQQFSFVRELQKERFLYIYNTAGRKLREIRTTAKADDFSISDDLSSSRDVFNNYLHWRPVLDGQERQWFVFVSNGSNGNHDVYLGRTDSDDYLQLTADAAIDSEPRWSPDGNMIAFVSTRGGASSIYLAGNLEEVMKNDDASAVTIEPLTHEDDEVQNIAWNPNPAAFLLAFSKREYYPSREIHAFQISVFDLLQPENNVLSVTNNPAMNYTRPAWNPYQDNTLAFIGQRPNKDAASNLYVSELRWREDKSLAIAEDPANHRELLKQVRLTDAAGLWLSGGKAILLQLDKNNQRFPLYSVNIERRKAKRNGAINNLDDLNRQYPFVSTFDENKGLLLFSTQEGRFFKMFAAQVYGDDISLYAPKDFRMDNPRLKDGGIPRGILVGVGITVATAVWAIIDCTWCPDPVERIGSPPSMPGLE